MTKKLSDNQIMTAILSYLGILWLIPLLVISKKKRDDFIKYHLQQGINLFIWELIVLIILGVLGYIPVIGILFAVLYWIAWVFFIIVIIIAIVKGVQGEKWKIPVLGGTKFVNL